MTAIAVARLLATRGDTLAVAESSTGGLILSQLTDVSGASLWLRGGLVPYTNNAKRDILGVPQETLAVYGAVSAETALAMAHGAARLFDA
ncbi:MAG: nicotinamide-nucleotide amidohydrolase family protein, partial [Chloroflexi bacterium]|nr:nicotinamide-nucleotide amidohydrolase family protein [Chloroflexota bacterium]